MLIRTLVSWGGHDFNLIPGDTMDVPDQTGADRVAAGLAEDATPVTPASRAKGRRAPDAFAGALD